MKNLLVASSLILSFTFADEFSANLQKTFPNSVVVSNQPLEFSGLNLVVLDQNGSTKIILTDKSASNLVVVNDAIFAKDKDQKAFKSAQNSTQNAIEKGAYEILKTIPDERFVIIESFFKDNPNTIYMVSDPECPYCRADMSKITKYLRNAHIKLIFTPVHGKSAYSKSAIILKESKKIAPSNQEALIKLINFYYDENTTVSDDMATDEERSAVLNDAKKVFSKGLIKGVPFKFSVKE
ncbi:MAG: hypothetical protein MR902_06535 [Campylobacter sp.]|nr:hypothetical protein [Campylobacter sp.]